MFCVFLILAAQYESWSLPFSVLLCTPIAVFGAFAGLMVGRFENNVYAQIGLVMLIGLSAKNAILIVEFAKRGVEEGKPILDAALDAARLRLRPILMTSFAFILGCVPLAKASGAGAASRQVMGFTVIGGMLAASFLAIFLIPVMFHVVERITEKNRTSNLRFQIRTPTLPAKEAIRDSSFQITRCHWSPRGDSCGLCDWAKLQTDICLSAGSFSRRPVCAGHKFFCRPCVVGCV
ncbi:MAG: efflux RND transporter permease subunit [Limisphaerales bacterium]